MFRRSCAFLLTIFILLSLFCLPACADTGPKASVELTLTGGEGRTYYVTLLSARRSTGPFSDNFAEFGDFSVFGDTDGSILARFQEYAETDDFFLLDYIEPCTDSFSWSYYPPDTFKVLVYDPETDAFACSDITGEYAFTSSFTVDLSSFTEDGARLEVVRSYNFLPDLLDALFRCALTLAVELLIALPFCLWKKGTIRIVVLINVVTQLLLNIGLSIYVYYSGNGFWLTIPYFFAELVTFCLEGFIYHCSFPEKMRARPLRTWGYSLAANACSFLLGVFLYLR